MKLSSLTLAAALLLAGTAHAGVTATDSTHVKLDASTANRLLTIGSHGTIEDVNLTVTFSKCDDPGVAQNGTTCANAGRSYDSEISLALINPTGYRVNLITPGFFNSDGNGAGGVMTIVFDDESSNLLGRYPNSGTYRPLSALSTFDGMDMFGNWTLEVRDTTGSDPLDYFSARLDINGGAPASDVPEPASLAILGLGLLGLGAARRARRQA